jgi:putative transposase
LGDTQRPTGKNSSKTATKFDLERFKKGFNIYGYSTFLEKSMTTSPSRKPSAELRLAVLCSIDHALGKTNRARIHEVSQRLHTDPITGCQHRFTWRTIQTWYSRHLQNGITELEGKRRKDRFQPRKISIAQLAEAIKETLPSINPNKVGRSLKTALYRNMLKRGCFTRSQLAPTTFYRRVRENDLLTPDTIDKIRLSFAMRYANEMWQADTMHGPAIKDHDGKYHKTYLIAFIDDASRLITHSEWYSNDNTTNMVHAFRCAMYKRGKPERLYFDNGSNYKAEEIHKACLRLGIKLSHTPVRDGAAKGKIERFFRGFRDRFLTTESDFKSLEDLNERTREWIENVYNNQQHRGIGMTPLERFNLDHRRIVYLCDDDYSAEAFFFEESRKVNKTNCITIHKKTLECPVYLVGKKIEIRYDRTRKDRYIVYHREKRMGEATPIDLHANADGIRKKIDNKK